MAGKDKTRKDEDGEEDEEYQTYEDELLCYRFKSEHFIYEISPTAHREAETAKAHRG